MLRLGLGHGLGLGLKAKIYGLASGLGLAASGLGLGLESCGLVNVTESLYWQKLKSLDYIAAADNVGVSSFIFVWLAAKNTCIMQLSA